LAEEKGIAQGGRMRIRAGMIAVASLFLLASHNASAKPEDWYLHLGMGYAVPKYPSWLKSTVDFAKNSGYSRMPLSIDLGFYWPILKKNSILGVAITGYVDSYSGPTVFDVIQTSVVASFLHSFGKEPGSGLLVRLDAGMASQLLQETSGPFSVAASSDTGYLGRAGVGFGFNITDGTRLIFMTMADFARISGDNYSTYMFNFSLLF
jgi:hypothetical protein